MALSIIFSSILFLLGISLIPYRLVASPCCCFLGLLIISMGKTGEGYPLLPISQGMILGWLFMAVLVTVLTVCQPAPIRNTRRGMYYYLGGALTGMIIGLLGFTFLQNAGGRYVFMIVATAVATFLGGLMYGSTPEGKNVGISSGNFFTYMLAKGFPTAISIMQLGTVLVLAGL